MQYATVFRYFLQINNVFVKKAPDAKQFSVFGRGGAHAGPSSDTHKHLRRTLFCKPFVFIFSLYIGGIRKKTLCVFKILSAMRGAHKKSFRGLLVNPHDSGEGTSSYSPETPLSSRQA